MPFPESALLNLLEGLEQLGRPLLERKAVVAVVVANIGYLLREVTEHEALSSETFLRSATHLILARILGDFCSHQSRALRTSKRCTNRCWLHRPCRAGGHPKHQLRLKTWNEHFCLTLSASFMLLVPDASVPAVLICTLTSAAGMRTSAIETLTDQHLSRTTGSPVVRDEADFERVSDIGVVVLALALFTVLSRTMILLTLTIRRMTSLAM